MVQYIHRRYEGGVVSLLRVDVYCRKHSHEGEREMDQKRLGPAGSFCWNPDCPEVVAKKRMLW